MRFCLISGEDIQKQVTFVKKAILEEDILDNPVENEAREGLKISQMHKDIDRREAMFALKLSSKVLIFIIFHATFVFLASILRRTA